MKTVKREPGGEAMMREWYDYHIVRTTTVHKGFEKAVLYDGVFMEQVVLLALKVDAKLPDEVLAELWVVIEIGGKTRGERSVYEFPCSAFDRASPDYKVKKDASGIEYVAVELKPATFKLPLVVAKNTHVVVRLYSRGQHIVRDLFAPSTVVVTLGGVTTRVVPNDPTQTPAPHPELGYCHFCEHHPVAPRKVPAVTKTVGGVPRCAPCGRWVD